MHIHIYIRIYYVYMYTHIYVHVFTFSPSLPSTRTRPNIPSHSHSTLTELPPSPPTQMNPPTRAQLVKKTLFQHPERHAHEGQANSHTRVDKSQIHHALSCHVASVGSIRKRPEIEGSIRKRPEICIWADSTKPQRHGGWGLQGFFGVEPILQGACTICPFFSCLQVGLCRHKRHAIDKRHET